ncbi:energy transducer TonB [Saccharophagus sp. K07]|uniref:energy transducer TonB n=1 Tax=Saccharophagus sp. K07 TaxID=2283636 RepID=UPI0016522114|nr:energy transducer TonB [Saccharophagus sp. K07]MBC6906032.1 energy transducer TonB [Saccharophagus sp. K07]
MSLDKTSSSERLSFTVFLAVAVHAILILGVTFTIDRNPKPAPTLNITLATHQSVKEPEKADYLAQFNQEASGTIADTKELTTRETSEVVSPNINPIVPVPQQRSMVATVRQQEFLTTESSDFKITQPLDAEAAETQEFREAQLEDTPLLNPEIASLRAKLDRLQQEFARRPRIRHMTSVATRSSVDAEYLNRWTQKVELMGNENFPRAALENQIFGSLRMSVIINADGTVDKVEILKPSGHPILDQAALQIIRLAGPFEPFPPEIRQTADQLDIIRTWRFEITGLKTGASD